MSLRVLSLLGLLCLAAHARAALQADYQFQETLASSSGSSPALAVVGSGTSYQVEPIVGLGPRTVFAFPMGSGLRLNPAAALDGTAYTVALLARIDTPTSYRKLLDFKNGTADQGLYDHAGHLQFYNYAEGTATPIDIDYHDLVLTRDALGALVVYVDGAPQHADDDSVNQYARLDASDTLRLFLDDGTSNFSEASGGAVARVRIWDTALSAAEVQALTDERLVILADGFEGDPPLPGVPNRD
jgi:hypothetical protein